MDTQFGTIGSLQWVGPMRGRGEGYFMYIQERKEWISGSHHLLPQGA